MFVALVVSVYFLMNWYVLARLAHLFAIRAIVPWPIVAAALALSLPAAFILDIAVGNRLTGVVLTAATMWSGICFLFSWCILALHLLGLVIKLPPKAVGAAAIGIVATLTLYAILNAPRVVLRQIEIAAPVDLRIVQISDVHLGSVGGAFFSRLVDRVNGIRPDAVLITGDLADNDHATTAAALGDLDRLVAPVFFVSGNHETYVGYDKVGRMLAPTKVRWLRNEVVALGKVRIVGVDDHTSPEAMDELLESVASVDDHAPDGQVDELPAHFAELDDGGPGGAIDQRLGRAAGGEDHAPNRLADDRLIRITGVDRDLPEEASDDLLGRGDEGEAFTILMCHRPESFQAAAGRGVDLMLSGHTHQGQLWPFRYVVRLLYRHVGGWHDIGPMRLHVSPGTGTWGPRMRLGSRSEITVIDLKTGN